jgi:hypothetical protein
MICAGFPDLPKISLKRSASFRQEAISALNSGRTTLYSIRICRNQATTAKKWALMTAPIVLESPDTGKCPSGNRRSE